jgi:hypothetical protein
MTNAGEYIMRKLFEQVFRPKELNGAKLIDKKYGGSFDGQGYSKPSVLQRRKKIEKFIQKIQSDFEVFLMCTEFTKATEDSKQNEPDEEIKENIEKD